MEKKTYGLTTQLLDEGRLRYAINNLNKDNKKNQDTSGEMGGSWLGDQVRFWEKIFLSISEMLRKNLHLTDAGWHQMAHQGERNVGQLEMSMSGKRAAFRSPTTL